MSKSFNEHVVGDKVALVHTSYYGTWNGEYKVGEIVHRDKRGNLTVRWDGANAIYKSLTKLYGESRTAHYVLWDLEMTETRSIEVKAQLLKQKDIAALVREFNTLFDSKRNGLGAYVGEITAEEKAALIAQIEAL